jgi:hypothetical protein
MNIPDIDGKLYVYSQHGGVKEENKEISDQVDRESGDHPKVRPIKKIVIFP